MKFRYKKYAPGVLRPIIPIEVGYGGVSIPYEVLIDSGADDCIFEAEIGELIGIDITTGTEKKVCGITGQVELYYMHPVTITVGGWPFDIEAGFLPNIAQLGHGVVGQHGFFDIFIVKFDFIKEIIELKERGRRCKK